MEYVTIRKATPEDIASLLLFEQAVIEAERPFDPTLKASGAFYYDLDKMISSPDTELVVAVVDDRIIGSGYARVEKAKQYNDHEEFAYLGFMYLDPDYRGKGINQMIIRYLKQWAISRNLTEIRLDVYHENERAVKAYEKEGFKKLMTLMRIKV